VQSSAATYIEPLQDESDLEYHADYRRKLTSQFLQHGTTTTIIIIVVVVVCAVVVGILIGVVSVVDSTTRPNTNAV
jgi:ABC-type amino acid transport system permease subunit